MRVLVVGNYSRNLVVFRGALLRELTRRGDVVAAVGPEDDPWVRGQLAEAGVGFFAVPLRRSSLNPLADIAFLVSLIGVIVRFNPRLLITFTHKPNVVGAVCAVFRREMVHVLMVEGLGYAFLRGTLRRSLVRQVLRVLYSMPKQLSAGAIFVNPRDFEDFRANELLSRQWSTLALRGIGIDLRRFEYSRPSFSPFVFLMVARVLRSKGVVEYCHAAAVVRSSEPTVRFVLVGDPDPGADGVPNDEFSELCARSGVEWRRFTVEIEKEYARCSAFVLPSYREGFPVCIMEAMATGRAVVTTDVPGCKDAVTHGENGIIVPARNYRALAEAMVKLVRDRQLAERFGRTARETAERCFDEVVHTRAQADWLRSVVLRSGNGEVVL